MVLKTNEFLTNQRKEDQNFMLIKAQWPLSRETLSNFEIRKTIWKMQFRILCLGVVLRYGMV